MMLSTLSRRLRPPHTDPSCKNTLRLFYRPIQTLIPLRLKSADFLDLSDKCTPTVNVLLNESSGARPLEAAVRWNSDTPTTFPPGAAGFLYYHVPPPGHPLCGELRFRVTNDSDPQSFDSGKDLHWPDGQSWRVPMHNLLKRVKYRNIVRLLVQESLLDPATMDLAAKLRYSPLHRTPIIHSLNQPFLFYFHSDQTFCVSTGDSLQRASLAGPLMDQRRDKPFHPYKGKFNACNIRDPC